MGLDRGPETYEGNTTMKQGRRRNSGDRGIENVGGVPFVWY